MELALCPEPGQAGKTDGHVNGGAEKTVVERRPA